MALGHLIRYIAHPGTGTIIDAAEAVEVQIREGERPLSAEDADDLVEAMISLYASGKIAGVMMQPMPQHDHEEDAE